MRAMWFLPRLLKGSPIRRVYLHVPVHCYYSQLPKPCLRTMKLDSAEFHQIFTPELGVLTELFKRHSFELRLAGGAVRDLLMGKQPHDFDFATVATPQQMKDMFDTEGIRMINRRGEKHGTITCRINDKANFEITTLRVDIVTDGRHAEVQFTKDWQLDALRRDLTINAMFLSFDGTVHDYFNGHKDLKDRRVCFVGDANSRIQEDYLRILRYFRFFGRISLDGCPHDKDTLSAIEDNMSGLQGISGERIWVEFRQILNGPQICDLMNVMLSLGMGPYIGLPAQTNLTQFEQVWRRCGSFNPKPLTLVAALLETQDQVQQLHARLKLSRDELQLGTMLVGHRDDHIIADPSSSMDDDQLLRHFKDWLCDSLLGAARGCVNHQAKEHMCELLKYCGRTQILDTFREWQLPRFPVSGIRLLEAGVPKGPALARVLARLREEWKRSEYTMQESELMDFVKRENGEQGKAWDVGDDMK